MPLPPCPACDTEDALQALRAEARGTKYCQCAICGRICRVNASGQVVWQREEKDR